VRARLLGAGRPILRRRLGVVVARPEPLENLLLLGIFEGVGPAFGGVQADGAHPARVAAAAILTALQAQPGLVEPREAVEPVGGFDFAVDDPSRHLVPPDTRRASGAKRRKNSSSLTRREAWTV